MGEELKNEQMGMDSSFDDLASIISGSKYKPQRIIVYGPQGVGKTTFASTFERPIILRTEDGLGQLNIPTFPKIARNYSEIMSAIGTLGKNKHNFKTLIIDSVDWVEPLIWNKVCEENDVKSVESLGYGRGYVECDFYWREFTYWLDCLRDTKEMDIVLIGHSEIKLCQPPDTEPYERYQIRIHKRAFNICQEWADMILFCNYIRNVSEKGRVIGDTSRVIITEELPFCLAKNRIDLKQKIEIYQDKNWTEFHRELNRATKGKYKIPERFLNGKTGE